ncbi:MAG TPA: S9 family peptidase [Trueperaceae bacterium]
MARLESGDLLRLEFVSDPRVAPDGRTVAAVITDIISSEDAPPRYRSRVELFEVGGGSRSLAQPPFSDTSPRFSSDGRSLAFLRKTEKEETAQLWLANLDDGDLRQLTEEPGGVEGFDWHPASNRIAYLAGGQEKPKEPPIAREIERLRYRFDGKGYLAQVPRRLRLVESDGTVGELDTVGLDVEELVWSHDGSYLVLVAARDQVESDEEKRRLWRLDPAGGSPRPLTEAMRLWAPSPGPRGEIAFLAPADPQQTAGPGAVWLVSEAGDDLRPLTGLGHDLSPSPGGDCRYGAHPNRPLWLSADELLVNLNSNGWSSLTCLSREGELADTAGTGAVVTAFHAAGGTVAYIEESSARTGQLYVRPAERGARRLTDLNSDLSERAGFVEAKGPFTPEAAGGAQYWRLDPQEPRDDLAIVVQVHGGPHTNVGHGFYFEYQLLAANGYTVIYGNPRGSSSYGQEFATAILGGYGTIDADDVLAFVDDALASHPDPGAPVHLTGGSYGGFMTNWLVAHTERFRSAVTQRSICNFVSFYGTSDIGWWFTERELKGDPWEGFERLWQQSPLRLARRVATPLLIIHSESDLRCPLEQAQQLFVALKRSGKAHTKLVIFPEENHELSRSGRPDRRVRRLDTIVGWFEANA